MKSLMGSVVSVSEPSLYNASQSETKPPITQNIQNQNLNYSPQTPIKPIANIEASSNVFTSNSPNQPNIQPYQNESKNI